MPAEAEPAAAGGAPDRTPSPGDASHTQGALFDASHTPGSRKADRQDVSALRARLEQLTPTAAAAGSGAGSTSPGGADVLRLKARAEILARKIDSASRQMASMAAATGPQKEPKSPSVSPGVRSWKSGGSSKAAKATELGHVRECPSSSRRLRWGPRPCVLRA